MNSAIAALNVREVSKSFGVKNVLHSINLKVARAETHVLLGLSGSGKSTLIRIILGLIKPDSGSVDIDGQEGAMTGKSSPPRQGAIGYVPQDGGLFPHLSASDNITLVARLQRMPAQEMKARLAELCELTSLESGLLKRFPRELSGGQKQRVSLVRAAFLNPPVLVLDEPFGALDPIIRIDLQDELKNIFNALGKSVLMVTHDIDEARFFGHALSILKEGRILQSGSFAELTETPRDPFVTKFIHSRRSWSPA